MKGNGLMIRHMEREHIRMLMALIIKEIGLMTSSMVWAWNHGQMVLSMKESIKMGRRTAEGS